jgi:tetratricopeptide (TPR) repeat protein
MRTSVGIFLVVLACGSCASQDANDSKVAPAPIATMEIAPPASGRPVEIVPETRQPVVAVAAPDDPAGCRDPRRGALTPRALPLIITELEGLNRLLGATPVTAQDHPQLLRRIAEDYAELVAAELKAGAQGRALNARRSEVATYEQLKTDHPTFAEMDEVLYFLALAYEIMGDAATARRTYFQVIQKFPSSKYVPHTYLAFGEMFFEEGANDPGKWQLALQAYNEVIKYPPPQNGVYAYAYLKHGRASVANGDAPRALSDFKKAIEASIAFPEAPYASTIGVLARQDLVSAYAKAGAPDRAYNFFRSVNGNVSGGSDPTFDMMEALGRAYIDNANGSHFPDAATLYRDLAARDVAHACKWRAYADVAMAATASHMAPTDAALQAALRACP